MKLVIMFTQTVRTQPPERRPRPRLASEQLPPPSRPTEVSRRGRLIAIIVIIITSSSSSSSSSSRSSSSSSSHVGPPRSRDSKVLGSEFSPTALRKEEVLFGYSSKGGAVGGGCS